jgi:AcrR family transcriptional regulator
MTAAGARARVRAELTREIVEAARRHLATEGAAGLSLRAVARELGMASSALYRYYPSRDDLLTALIIDAYDAIGERVETAEAAVKRTDHLERWRAACSAVRDWAHEHPWEYALIYGSPVVGYRAPQDTATPASRVPRVLLATVADANTEGKLEVVDGPRLPRQTSQEIAHLVALLPELELEPVLRSNLAAVLAAWTQLYGMVSFELWGHFQGVIDDTADVFRHTTDQLAYVVGLRKLVK